MKPQVKRSKLVRLREAGMPERKVAKKTGATVKEIRKVMKRAKQNG